MAAGFLLSGLGAFAEEAPEGRIISLHGRVEHQPRRRELWNPARILEELFEEDRVRTFQDSRTAILFLDETQVRLRDEAELTVRRVASRQEGGSVFDLARGEGWFRTKNTESDLTITTPAVTAAIRGTEVNVEVDQGGRTVVTVVEGSVIVSNDFGSIEVSLGEQGIANPGEAPVKAIILQPEDAVQWVLYYPVDMSYSDIPPEAAGTPIRKAVGLLRRGDPDAALAELEAVIDTNPWAPLLASVAHLEGGDIQAARGAIDRDPIGKIGAWHAAQRGAVELAVGNTEAAEELLTRALALDAENPRALSLLSTTALTQNRIQEARSYAQRALDANPNSASAHIVAGEVSQALYDLPSALSHFGRALDADPDSARARLNRARVRFGTENVSGAEEDTEWILNLNPLDAHAASLAGFLHLARNLISEAEALFEPSYTADPTLGEPHIGLGIVRFSQKREEEALWELLTATLLEPKRSLYQSYLGKGYYQLKRDAEALSALESASTLDPLDPTPHLYMAVILEDQYRHAEALSAYRTAMLLNDNRGVYRGRLLLDRDHATANVSLAGVYRQFGFERRGLAEAIRSVTKDPTNAGAHLLLSDLFYGLPGRLQAQKSEYLQYLVYSPVSRNSFTAYNEYTALFEQPRFGAGLGTTAGYPLSMGGQLTTVSGNPYFAHLALLNVKGQEGTPSENTDVSILAAFRAKVAMGLRSNLFFQLMVDRALLGDYYYDNVLVGEDTDNPIKINVPNENPDPNLEREYTDFGAILGFKHVFGPGNTHASVFQFMNVTSDSLTTISADDILPGLELEQTYNFKWQAYGLQKQQTLALGRHRFAAGAEGYLRSINTALEITESFFGSTFDEADASVRDYGGAAWLWDGWEPADWLHLTAGVRYQRDIGEDFVSALFGEEVKHDYTGFYPLGGASLYIGNHLVLRAAAFQRLNARLFGDKLAPTTVESFLLDRSEQNYAKRTEYNAALETIWDRFFHRTHVYRRWIDNPPESLDGIDDAVVSGVDNAFNLLVHPRVGLSVENRLSLTETDPYRRIQDEVEGGIAFSHPDGFRVRLTNTTIFDRYSETEISELEDAVYNLLGLEADYALPDKRGTITLAGKNLLDVDFTRYTDTFTNLRSPPHIEVAIDLRLRF
jgi:tetratricopeptide (TPR) repeat protein